MKYQLTVAKVAAIGDHPLVEAVGNDRLGKGVQKEEQRLRHRVHGDALEEVRTGVVERLADAHKVHLAA